jgi:hypothetical protein
MGYLLPRRTGELATHSFIHSDAKLYQESDPKVRKKYAQCLLFLVLNLLNDYDAAPVLELLRKDQDELLQAFRKDHTDLFKAAPANPQRIAEFHRISLLRRLFVFSGGRDDFLQRKIDPKYTANDNVNLYGSFVGVTGSNRFGNFDSQAMLSALSKSKVFTDEDIRTLNIVELSGQMLASLPIGFPQGYLV